MNEPMEKRLCRRIAEALNGALKDVSVEGNWLPETSGLMKAGQARPSGQAGHTTCKPGRLDVEVGTRRYESYTSRVCEIRAWLYGAFPAAQDVNAERTATSYGELMGLLEEWQGDIAAAKEALRLEDFEPAGFRLDGGKWQIDAETKERTYSQSFTVRGRLKSGLIIK